MTQHRIETGHHGWSCPHPLRPIGLPHHPMACGFLTLQDRQARHVCVLFRQPIVDFRPRQTIIGCTPPIHYVQEKMMKYICLGYLDEKQWDTLSDSERNAQMDACFAYDDVL